MKLSTFLLLLEGMAFFPSVSTLRLLDPMECDLGYDFHRHFWNRIRNMGFEREVARWLESETVPLPDEVPYEDLIDSHAEVIGRNVAEQLSKHVAAWCWFRSDIESAPMWSVYANQGVAVRTKYNALREALPKGKDFRCQKIRYIDRRPRSELGIENLVISDPDAILRPYNFKGLEYQSENELRVIARCKVKQSGVMIKGIDPSTLIQEVIVSRAVPYAEFEVIDQLVKAKLGRSCVRQSNLAGSGADWHFTEHFVRNLYGSDDVHLDRAHLPKIFQDL